VRRSTRTRKSVVKNNGNSSAAKPLNRKKQFKEKSMKKSEEQLKEIREEKKLEAEKKRVESTGNIGKTRLSRKNLKGNSKKKTKATRKNASAPAPLSVIPENSIPQENINANLLAAFKKLSLGKSK
jgi:hypothetical protein